MHILLRTLIFLMFASISLTMSVALKLFSFPISHIQLAIITFLYTIFAQAFVMFYFIGVSRLAKNVGLILNSNGDLHELFDSPPTDLAPYKEKTHKFIQDTDLFKRQTIPWTMLILVLGTIAFLLGGAHDTGLVRKTIHSGVVYGFFIAMIIGFFRQWFFLGKANTLLRKLKKLFSLPDGSM